VTLEQPFQLQVRLFPAIQGEGEPQCALRPICPTLHSFIVTWWHEQLTEDAI